VHIKASEFQYRFRLLLELAGSRTNKLYLIQIKFIFHAYSNTWLILSNEHVGTSCIQNPQFTTIFNLMVHTDVAVWRYSGATTKSCRSRG